MGKQAQIDELRREVNRLRECIASIEKRERARERLECGPITGYCFRAHAVKYLH